MTPENNVQWAALKLLRFKMLKAIEEGKKSNFKPEIPVEELNDILIVAGFEVVVPEETKVKEIDVIKIEEEA